MAPSEPVWRIWQARNKSKHRLRSDAISWPLTRLTGLDLPEPALPRLRRTRTESEHKPQTKPSYKAFSSYPIPPPSVQLEWDSTRPPPKPPQPAPLDSAFPILYPTPPPSAQLPPTFRNAPPLIESLPPPSPTASDQEYPQRKCTLARSNARRKSSGRHPNGRAMASDLLSPRLTGARVKQAEAAREMQLAVEDRAEHSGVSAPPYDLLELIGKGAFGRVYKGKQRETNELVAIKVCDIDKVDYGEASHAHRDETIKQLVKETGILQQLKDSSAENVNRFYESFAFHSQLWLITEYVAGGSVRTLMRATPGGTPQKPMPLEEHFIIPIAREVAIGLKYVHEAGILHRDIKCANVMINQEGRVQLIDFGVSGLLETSIDKRSTIIGTPNWMPPELIKDQVGAGYGTEVDCWAFGCTVYEMATGLPPDAGRNFEFLANRRQPPRLEGDQYSSGLRDFVSFILKERPYERPSVAEILQHPYVFGTEESHPNQSLSHLVKRFLDWQDRGGNRTSLWAAGGAEGLDPMDPQGDGDEDWIFSTTIEFERDFAYEKRLSMVDPFRDYGSDARKGAEDDAAPKGRRKFVLHQKAMKEQQIKRGEAAMERLFNLDAPDYKYGEEPQPPYGGQDSSPDRSSSASDLALRNWEPNRASNRVTMIDLDAADTCLDSTPNLDLANASTLRASRINKLMKEMEDDEEDDYTYQPNRGSKRATKDWKFPMMEAPAPAPPAQESKNRRTMDWTFATSSMAEAPNDETPDYPTRVPRRTTKELSLPVLAEQSNDPDDRRSMLPGFSFPMMPAGGSAFDRGPRALDPSPPFGAAFRPQLRHAATQPIGPFDDFTFTHSAPESPGRTSMIDLDFADVSFVPRPPTASSMADSFTASVDADITTGNPFDLEEQAQLSHNNNRASYHRQSQSEPHKRVSGLLTPQDQEDERAQGYTSDYGPSVQGRDEQNRVSIGSRKSSVARDSDTIVPHRLVNQKRRTRTTKDEEEALFVRFSSTMSAALADPSRIEEGSVRGRRNAFNTNGNAPSFNPESPSTWRYQDTYSSTPPSTNGSISSSTIASPETALAYNGEFTQLTTPSTSITAYSPRSTTSFSTQIRDSQPRMRMPLRTARPRPTHPAALENRADPRILVTEASKAARNHVLYLKTLRRTLKACGSQAQARRAGRKPRNGSANGGGNSMSSTDNSDIEGINGTARRLLRRVGSNGN